MNTVEGKRSESITVKDGGSPVSDSFDQGAGAQAQHGNAEGLIRVGFESGRTIGLRAYEFARVRIGLRVAVPDGVPVDSAKLEMEDFIRELVEREEAGVSGVDRTEREIDLPLLGQCIGRVFVLSYGLTLKSTVNKFESHQVDLMTELPITDGPEYDLWRVFELTSDDLVADLERHKERIKNPDTGL